MVPQTNKKGGRTHSIREISRVDLDTKQELGVVHASANRVIDFEQDSLAVLRSSTILIRTVVNARRQELRKKVAVGGVKLLVDSLAHGNLGKSIGESH